MWGRQVGGERRGRRERRAEDVSRQLGEWSTEGTTPHALALATYEIVSGLTRRQAGGRREGTKERPEQLPTRGPPARSRTNTRSRKLSALRKDASRCSAELDPCADAALSRARRLTASDDGGGDGAASACARSGRAS